LATGCTADPAVRRIGLHCFSNEYWDDDLGLVYYNYRYYSPKLGRWLSRDPIEEQGGLNLYGFCGNGPYDATDALGLWGWDGGLIEWGVGGMIGVKGARGTARAAWSGFGEGGMGGAHVITNTLTGGYTDKIGYTNAGEYLKEDPDTYKKSRTLTHVAIASGSAAGGGLFLRAAAVGGTTAIGGLTTANVAKTGVQMGAAYGLLEKGYNYTKTAASGDEYHQTLVDDTNDVLRSSIYGGIFSYGFFKFMPKSPPPVTTPGNSARGEAWFEEVAAAATRNPESDTLVLGHFSRTGGTSYQKVAAHYKATYFKVDNYDAVTKGLEQDEIFRINETFLIQQLRQGKNILFSHNPLEARSGSFFEREVNFLKELGYSFRQKNQWTWEVVK
jgi:RHS repeat-associated protein